MAPRPSHLAATLLLFAVTPTSAQERWTLVPELRIGSVDDPATALSPVGSILVGADGRMYLSQSQQKEIRIYSPDGELLRVIGGEGSGPGEFRNVSSLFWRGDTLQVLDFAQQRFSLFTADGDFIRTYRPLPRGAIVRHLVSAEFPDGSVFARVRGGREGPQPLLRITGPGEPDTVAWVSGGQAPSAPVNVGNQVIVTFLPLWPADRTSLGQNAETITIVHQPQPDSPDSAFFWVRRVTPRGATLFDARFRYRPRPIAAGEIEQVLGRRLGAADRPAATVERIRADLMEAFHQQGVPMPAYHVPVARLRTGADGTSWLRLSTPDTANHQWLVLDDTGQLIARLSVPGSVSLHRMDGRHVWGVELDALDVPYVVRYRVEVLEER